MWKSNTFSSGNYRYKHCQYSNNFPDWLDVIIDRIVIFCASKYLEEQPTSSTTCGSYKSRPPQSYQLPSTVSSILNQIKKYRSRRLISFNFSVIVSPLLFNFKIFTDTIFQQAYKKFNIALVYYLIKNLHCFQ